MTATSELIIRQIIKTASRHIIMLILFNFLLFKKTSSPPCPQNNENIKCQIYYLHKLIKSNSLQFFFKLYKYKN